MKLKLTTLALTIATLASAQQVTVVSHEQLLRGVESQCYSPVISSDGTKVLFTGERYSGLKLYDIPNNVTTRIADDAMAGFMPTFSPNADKVYYLSQTSKDMLTYRSVKCFDIAQAKSIDITAPERGMRSPVATSTGIITVSDNGRQLRGNAAGTTNSLPRRKPNRSCNPDRRTHTPSRRYQILLPLDKPFARRLENTLLRRRCRCIRLRPPRQHHRQLRTLLVSGMVRQ